MKNKELKLIKNKINRAVDDEQYFSHIKEIYYDSMGKKYYGYFEHMCALIYTGASVRKSGLFEKFGNISMHELLTGTREK